MRLKEIAPAAVLPGSQHPFADRQRMHGIAGATHGQQRGRGVVTVTAIWPSGAEVTGINGQSEPIDEVARPSELGIIARAVQVRSRVAWRWLLMDSVDPGG